MWLKHFVTYLLDQTKQVLLRALRYTFSYTIECLYY